MALNQIVFEVDPTTHEVTGKSQAVLRLKSGNSGATFNYTPDPATADIVQDAVDEAGPLGAVPLGQIAARFSRAHFTDGGATDNRGGESTLGNLVAEVQRWATQNPESGSAQIAFMNPGGLRADIIGVGNPGDPYPRTVTYRQAADVQPFANTLVNMDLTGAQIKAALEQQWQPAGAARPFLRLGASKGFEYTYNPETKTVTGMWLNGTPVGLGTTYSVTVNSFLAAGGDNFGAFAGGTSKQDTGKIDLQAMVDYLDEFANPDEGDQPLPISYAQQAVGVKFPADAPASYKAGTDHVKFDLTSLSMTETGADRDTQVLVKLGGTTLGTFPVTTTLSPPGNLNSNDEAGTASVDVVLPAATPGGTATLVVEGPTTGTSFRVPVTVLAATTPTPTPATTTVGGTVEKFRYGNPGSMAIVVSRPNATGTAEVYDEDGVKIATATITAGKGTAVLPAKSLKPGVHELTLKYLGTSEFAPSQATVKARVLKAKPKVKIKVDDTVDKAGGDKVVVKVTAPDKIKVRGKVTLVIKGTGKSITVKLKKGRAVFELPKIAEVGTYTLKAKYSGSPLLTRKSKSVKVEVVK
jgi:5'-nucleotidase